jgi:hypothetical protein
LPFNFYKEIFRIAFEQICDQGHKQEYYGELLMDRYVDFMEEIMAIYRSEMRNKAGKKMLDFSFTSDILSEWA